jgi:hypothetical protein
MKTIKQFLSNYLRERREIIGGEKVLFVGIVIAVAIVAWAVFIVLGIDVNPIGLIGIAVLGYLAWIVFFKKRGK